MPERSTVHETFVIERTYDAPPARVFVALKDVEARLRWGTPNKTVAITFLETDFRIGGRDVSRCGPVHRQDYLIDVRYQDIVDDERIVSVETVSHGETRLASALITVELLPHDTGTRLKLTDQIAVYEGAEMVNGSKAGWSGALDNLGVELKRDAAANR